MRSVRRRVNVGIRRLPSRKRRGRSEIRRPKPPHPSSSRDATTDAEPEPPCEVCRSDRVERRPSGPFRETTDVERDPSALLSATTDFDSEPVVLDVPMSWDARNPSDRAWRSDDSSLPTTDARGHHPFHRGHHPFHRGHHPFHRGHHPFHRDDPSFHRRHRSWDDLPRRSQEAPRTSEPLQKHFHRTPTTSVACNTSPHLSPSSSIEGWTSSAATKTPCGEGPRANAGRSTPGSEGKAEGLASSRPGRVERTSALARHFTGSEGQRLFPRAGKPAGEWGRYFAGRHRGLPMRLLDWSDDSEGVVTLVALVCSSIYVSQTVFCDDPRGDGLGPEGPLRDRA
jgi:hypothetical protein